MTICIKAMVLSGWFCGLAGGLNAQAAEKDLDAAIMPGADLVTKFDVKNVLTTPFYKEVKNEAKDVEMIKFLEILGLTVDDLGSGVLACDFDVAVPGVNGTDDPAAAIAVDSAKPWDLQKITAMIILEQAKKKRQVETSALTLGGKAVTKFKTSPEAPAAGQPARADKEQDFFMAADGTILLVTNTEATMTGALTRKAAGEMATLDPQLAAYCAAAPQAQVRGGIVFPEKIKAKMKGDGKPIQGNGPNVAIQESFRNLQQVGWTIVCDKDAVIKLNMGLDSKETADKGVMAVNGMVGMIRGFMAMQQGQPQANPQVEVMGDFLNGFKIAGQGKDVMVDLTVTAAWCKKAQGAKQAAANRVVAPPQEE